MTELLLSGRAILLYEMLIILVLAGVLWKQKKKQRESRGTKRNIKCKAEKLSTGTKIKKSRQQNRLE